MNSVIVAAERLALGYKRQEPVIKDASFSILEKEFIFITGPSGSGKSTLLKSLYGEMEVYGGALEILGIDMQLPKEKEIETLRRHIGIVFQDYKLIKDWSVERNVMLPMIINGFSKELCRTQTTKLLNHIKLSHKAHNYPLELSGGEQQRVAMARALAHNPIMILADEPTGNLDEHSSDIIWNLLRGANETLGISVVVVTHMNPKFLGIHCRQFHIEEGRVHEVS
ncbi:ABC transporter ATP-binding protein [Helicobacter monodelphidis]|uniref:cell division ATP-binding protein FtsE n=1 Tax=Helicobacter sp. 15-1451 TaxID=2004995 RepID=UPI000DCC52FF|nr:ABC transporter ATP-binding protein [Helicobacter sp. 15-1451]RAX58640.1 ABC transporter ATP-binding protein [Helicobacter sp. 15-1451]